MKNWDNISDKITDILIDEGVDQNDWSPYVLACIKALNSVTEFKDEPVDEGPAAVIIKPPVEPEKPKKDSELGGYLYENCAFVIPYVDCPWLGNSSDKISAFIESLSGKDVNKLRWLASLVQLAVKSFNKRDLNDSEIQDYPPGLSVTYVTIQYRIDEGRVPRFIPVVVGVSEYKDDIRVFFRMKYRYKGGK